MHGQGKIGRPGNTGWIFPIAGIVRAGDRWENLKNVKKNREINAIRLRVKYDSLKNSPKILKVGEERGYDYVWLSGKKIHLGKSGTQEADAAFRLLQIQVIADPTLSFLISQEKVTVNVLCAGYLKYAKENDSSHYYSIKTAIKILLDNFR